MLLKFLDNKTGYLYLVFRIFVGLLFAQHGFQKVFGLMGGEALPIFSFFWFSGFIELVAGLLVAFGLFTRVSAIISTLEMVIAYFMVHVSKAFFPINNGGELALMYFASFLIISAYGAQKWSLEKLLIKKEIF